MGYINIYCRPSVTLRMSRAYQIQQLAVCSSRGISSRVPAQSVISPRSSERVSSPPRLPGQNPRICFLFNLG